MYPMLIRRETRSSASHLAGSPQLSWKSQIGGSELGMHSDSTRVPVQGGPGGRERLRLHSVTVISEIMIL